MTSNPSYPTSTAPLAPLDPSSSEGMLSGPTRTPDTPERSDSQLPPTSTHHSAHSSSSNISDISPSNDSSITAAYRRGQLIKQHFQQWLQAQRKHPVTFTKVSCRNDLMKHPELADCKTIVVLQRVRDLIDRLVIDGQVAQVDTIGRRRRVYQLVDSTSGHPTSSTAPANRHNIAENSATAPPPQIDSRSHLPLDAVLQEQRRTLKKAMHAAKAEAEHLYQLAQDYPDAKSDIAPLQDDALQRACEFQGQLAAVLALYGKRHAGGES